MHAHTNFIGYDDKSAGHGIEIIDLCFIGFEAFIDIVLKLQEEIGEP